jgi:hypothetical protein
MRRYLWLLPFLLMVCATLACDGPTYDPPQVRRLYVDPQNPNKVYAEISGNQDLFTQDYMESVKISRSYESDNYGENWRTSTFQIPKEVALHPPEMQVTWENHDERFKLNGEYRQFYTFPRKTFRTFFSPADGTYGGRSGEVPYFMIPGYTPLPIARSTDGRTVYIGLGTEGVLVGRTVDSRLNGQWTLTRSGFDILHPLPLKLTDPASILSVTGAALIIPPLAFLHFFVLAQVYRYAYQPGEHLQAYKFSGRITAGLTGLAALAVIFWLTNDQIDYYPIVGTMTLICAGAGVGGAVYISRKRLFTTRFTQFAAVGAALVSLIVPLGVAAVWFLWPLIIGLICAFIAYRRLLEQYLERNDVIASQWGKDRLVLEIMAIMTFVLLPLLTMTFFSLSGFALAVIPGFFVVAILSLGIATSYLRWRSKGFSFKHKVSDSYTGIPQKSPELFRGMAWLREVGSYTVSWLVVAGVLASGVFFGQMIAFQYFQTLLVK